MRHRAGATLALLSRRFAVVTALVALVALFAAACQPAKPPPVWTPIDPSYEGDQVTRDGTDTYALTKLGSTTATATANETNTGGNTRAAYWPAGQEPSTDKQVCARWDSESGPINQQGAAFRLNRPADGFTRVLTVTKNVWAYANYIFNIHYWDEQGAHIISQFNMATALSDAEGQLIALPWDFCARISGSAVEFIVWIDGQPQPAWGDALHGGSSVVPSGWETPGEAGWYVGHLQPGDSTSYSHMTIGSPSDAPIAQGPARSRTELAHPEQAPPPRLRITHP
jgi:hypothetical protein